MQKRIDQVYQYMIQRAESFVLDGNQEDLGVTTKEVADALAIQRTNASADLNELVREGKLRKVDGRPVKYVYEKKVLYEPLKKYVTSYKEERQPRKIGEPQFVKVPAKEQDIFSKMIGARDSMKNAVEQAKAAVLYPPKGLNCLITGPTGSGKTYFAHAMFQFAQSNRVIDQEKELIVFNCADYANNPELLMSHLFGYIQGAFTGADQEKTGIIDQANGGMLFLDEIHRLPPEGQEMIFYFMDHGTYSRLGENRKNHQADVRIVCATTEDPNSSLLDTFVRRIPINIHLPSFEQRPASEKLDLVKVLVGQEARRIQRRISLTEDVVKALIGSVSYGNIGQLKSNIQLACARGFLDHMHDEEIVITMAHLPEGIRSGVMILANQRDSLTELSQLLEPKLTIYPDEDRMGITTDSYELPYNLYDIIGDKAAVLKADGLDQESINHFISTDINIHLKTFYKDHGFTFNTTSKLSEFVDQQVIEMTNDIFKMVNRSFDYSFQENFVYAMSLHISSFLKKIHDGEERVINDNIRQMVSDYPQEFAMAKEIRLYIEEQLRMGISHNEDYYLAVLLISLRANQKAGRVGVVVAAHGNSTASSMVQVVKQLLQIEQIAAVDMPLEMAPKTVLEKIKQAVQSVDQGRGVILLVDMGSLGTFDELISRELAIDVRSVDMVTTAVVLEAARKAALLETTLDELHESLRSFRGYVSAPKKTFAAWEKKQAILAICASGEGTAKRIQELIVNALASQDNHQVEVIPISVVDLQTELALIQDQYQLIAATGIVDPEAGVPFIPLDSFIDQDVHLLLEPIINGNHPSVYQLESQIQDEVQAKETAKKFVKETLMFVNPEKLMTPIWNFVNEIDQNCLEGTSTFAFQINFAVHTAGMVERILLKEPLMITAEEEQQLLSESLYPYLHLQIQSLERILLLEVPVGEEYYLLEMIKTVWQK